jgi:hypothetical protein
MLVVTDILKEPTITVFRVKVNKAKAEAIFKGIRRSGNDGEWQCCWTLADWGQGTGESCDCTHIHGVAY